MKREPRWKLRKRMLNNIDRMIAKVSQIVRDANYWNELHPNERPMDTERDRALLANLRGQRQCVTNDVPIPEKYSRIVTEMAESGQYE
jgi:hypothetical protein